MPGFQAMDPFRRDGIMAWRVSEDEMSTLAYSMYATGFTFFNGAGTSYGTLGDTRFATQIGDSRRRVVRHPRHALAVLR